jgi:hypothetical protein
MLNNTRVHVAPVGLDTPERIIDPLERYKADRVYLGGHGSVDVKSEVYKVVWNHLKSRHPEIELRSFSVDVWDLFSCLNEYRKIFVAESSNHIYVNVSTGSRIAAIGGMLSCMIWGGTPYYAKIDFSGAEPENQKKDTPLRNEVSVLPVGKAKVSTVETLPVYRIMKPSDDMLKILFIIQQAGGKLSKKHLIEKLQSEDVRLIPVSSDAQTKSASHSRLKPFLEPMTQEWGFVTVKYKGRKSEVLLTEQGRKALKIFGSNFEQTYQTA